MERGMGNPITFASIFVAACVVSSRTPAQQPLLDLREIPCDLTVPQLTSDEPAAGRRVKQQLPAFVETKIFHLLYLPTNWERGKKYPVIFEYPGNGPYKNKLGDTNSGRVEDCNLGYGISAGKDFIWVCLPFVDPKTKAHALQWWGDADTTVEYCKAAVKHVCDNFGGDPQRLVLCGFSRGAIACNYIGLRDDETAGLWRCMVVHSHYDGVHRWPYVDSDAVSATSRLMRLQGRPQFITHEASVADIEAFLKSSGIKGLENTLTLRSLPFANHTSEWILRDIPERKQLREWLTRTLK
jgi:hypothetical protein